MKFEVYNLGDRTHAVHGKLEMHGNYPMFSPTKLKNGEICIFKNSHNSKLKFSLGREVRNQNLKSYKRGNK